jgi:hypothetical protein
MEYAMPVDANLDSFTSLTHPWSGILIGNGASRAVSSGFAYQSLFSVAQSPPVPNPLSLQAISLFAAMSTTNFEQVLSALISAETVNTILGLNTGPINMTYQNIRQALIEAVHAIHIPWLDIPAETLQKIRDALRQYRFVYSTNYDLLIYWAIMQDQTGFVDYFFGPLFDASNTEIWNATNTRVLFLHGALHLSRTIEGTLKRASGTGGNILDTFGDLIPSDPNAIPLFISEGSSQSKLASIRSNDYLSFAYGEFVNHSGGLVIFGQSMDPQFDQHLINALRGRGNRHLAVGIYRGTRSDTEIINEKVGWFMRFDGLGFTVDFFDSTSHPLGAADLFAY